MTKHSNEDHFDNDELVLELQNAFASGVIPSTDFLRNSEEAGLRGLRRRKLLEKLGAAARRVSLAICFSDYVEHLADAAGVSRRDAMLALGYNPDDSFGELDQPSAQTAEAALLLGIPREVAKDMMRAACLKDSCALAARQDTESLKSTYPHQEIRDRIELVRSEGVASGVLALDRCEQALAMYFGEDV